MLEIKLKVAIFIMFFILKNIHLQFDELKGKNLQRLIYIIF